MENQIFAIDPSVDPHSRLGFLRNPDGSVTRLPEKPPESPASADPNNRFHLSKDITINHTKNTWVRIFVPRKAFDDTTVTKLPIIVYFHAGGFVAFSPATSLFDNFYTAIVTEVPVVIVSVDHRLAPEHRLPAAYDDCMEAMHWLKNCNDDWITKYGDLSKCFLMGSSSGGNICYRMGLCAATMAEYLNPLKIKGLILHHAYFGGKERTGSELRLANDKVLPLRVNDVMWELALPTGADRDHEYSNPMIGMKRDSLDHMKILKWKVLVIGCTGDPLIDREIELVKKLEEHGLAVVSKFDEGGWHGYDGFDPLKTKDLSKTIKEFIASSITF